MIQNKDNPPGKQNPQSNLRTDQLFYSGLTMKLLSLSKNQQTQKQALRKAQQMFVSAQPKAVHTLYKVLPKLIQVFPPGELNKLLGLCAKVYNGTPSVKAYPSFSKYEKFMKYVGNDDPLLTEFKANLKAKSDKIQFFDDSFITQTDDMETQRQRFQKVMFDIAEIQNIRERIGTEDFSKENLQEKQQKIICFQKNYGQNNIFLIRQWFGMQEGATITSRIKPLLSWCEAYRKHLPRYLSREINLKEFWTQLQSRKFAPLQLNQIPNMTYQESMFQNSPDVYSSRNAGKGISLTSKRESLTNRLSKTPQKQPIQIIHQKPKPTTAIVSPSKPTQTPLQAIDLEPQQYDVANPRQTTIIRKNTHIQSPVPLLQEHIISTQRLSPSPRYVTQRQKQLADEGKIDLSTPVQFVVTAYKPKLQQSTRKHKLHIFSKKNEQSPYPNQYTERTLSALKLSDFVFEKQKRKEKIDFSRLHQTPEWIMQPYMDLFESEDLYSRFRKSCLQKRSVLFKNSQVEVTFRVDRESSMVISVAIGFVNLTQNPIDMKVTYSISKSLKVAHSENIKSRFTLSHQPLTHTFSLQITSLPLLPCLLDLSLNAQPPSLLPLPITILCFTLFSYLPPEDFFLQWNRISNNFYTDTKILHSRKIISVPQMTFLFPEMTELGKKENYSYDEFGCVAKYEYFDVGWMVVFAFNVDSLVTVEILSQEQKVNKEQAEFLEYWMNTMAMLIEKVE